MKLCREDDVWLYYRGQKHFLKDNSTYGRGGTKSPRLKVYTLESGIRILPVHFRLGLAEIPGNIMSWLLKANMPKTMMRAELTKADYLLSKINKSPWPMGTTISVPLMGLYNEAKKI